MEFVNFGVLKANYNNKQFTFAPRFVYVSPSECRALGLAKQRIPGPPRNDIQQGTQI